MATFAPATKKQARLRLAFIGPAGSGKTYSALAVGTNLGKRVAVIDTERGSASKYAGLFKFDVLEITEPFTPAKIVAAIKAAESEGYDVCIVDSLSHSWAGTGGALSMVDDAVARSGSKNSYFAWREITPEHNRLVDAMLNSKCHVIATMRSKMEYVIEKDEKSGKSYPRKIGMAPIQREGMEYEFDVTGDLDNDNRYIISKTRCPELNRAIVEKPGKEFAETLKAWLSDGAAAAPIQPTTHFDKDLNIVSNAGGTTQPLPATKAETVVPPARTEIANAALDGVKKVADEIGEVQIRAKLSEIVKLKGEKIAYPFIAECAKAVCGKETFKSVPKEKYAEFWGLITK